MNSKEIIFYLRGFMDAAGDNPTPGQWLALRQKLQKWAEENDSMVPPDWFYPWWDPLYPYPYVITYVTSGTTPEGYSAESKSFDLVFVPYDTATGMNISM